MVTVLTSKNIKFKINEKDHNPPHVHAEGGGASLRINLNTLEIMDERTGFSKAMTNYIVAFVTENRILLLDEWERKHG